ncbi:TspO/MBR family protein [Flavobacterium aciduliphilum]|uniref:TspO/MBR related protein n=1 Tax=Flavobacterium aciduliphilum TaxID=1101402 RepID=A0A328YK66_9FLAO|nr:TspO/MBR family protein [Flavobacterium aciduliphilum]RAR72442.1 TspO/MBR related protein [Flavobacterium aciduliphilum]
MQRQLRLLITLFTSLIIGYLSGLLIQESFYSWFQKPTNPLFFISPPLWITFASIFYFLYGLFGGLLWNTFDKFEVDFKQAFSYYILGFVLVTLWFYIFFCLQNVTLALIESVLTTLFLYELYLKSKKIDPKIARYIFPCVFWNTAITLLNSIFFFIS